MALLGGPHSSDNKVISTYISPTAKHTKITVCIQGQNNNTISQTHPVKDHIDHNLTTLNSDATIVQPDSDLDSLSGKRSPYFNSGFGPATLTQGENSSRVILVPVELKTGRNSEQTKSTFHKFGVATNETAPRQKEQPDESGGEQIPRNGKKNVQSLHQDSRAREYWPKLNHSSRHLMGWRILESGSRKNISIAA